MAKISISISRIKQFIELVSCEGKTDDGAKQGEVIKEFVINVGQRNIETYATDRIGKIFAYVSMVADVIEPGNIVIGDAAIFGKYLDVFEPKDEVTISQSKGVIRIERAEPKKFAKFTSVSIEHIETHKTAELINNMWELSDDMKSISTKTTTLDCCIIADAEDFSQIVKDSQVVGEQYYPFSISKLDGIPILKVEVGSLQTSMGVIKSIVSAQIESSVEELNNKYAYGFDNVFSSLKGQVILLTGPDMPLWVIKNESDYSVRFMLTPVTN